MKRSASEPGLAKLLAQQSFILEGSVRMSDPLLFYIPFLARKFSFRVHLYLLLTIGPLSLLTAVDALSFK